MRLQTIALGLFLVAAPAFAEESAPVDINADALEYHEQEQTYVARGNAVIVQGTVTIAAGVITAHFTKGEDGKTSITQAEAEGGVTITSGENKVTGERGVYDITRGVAVVKGGDLRLTTPQDTVTAQDSLEYWEKQKLAVARGNAVAVRGDKRVAADVLTGLLEDNSQKQQTMRRIGAEGHVQITTPTEVARGDRATYDVKTERAVLDGAVKLTRGENQLNGARAEVDMKTGVSRLLAGGGRRVSGLIMPKDAAPEVR